MTDPRTVIIDGVAYAPAPTEEAPKPEPVERWRAVSDPGSGGGKLWTRDGAPSLRMIEEVAEDLNALDRDGVAWGEPRPVSELRDEMGWVLYTANGIVSISLARVAKQNGYADGWWPLP